MNLIQVNQSEKDLYNHFVMNNESGSFLQAWEWGDWQTSLGREVFRFKILDSNNQILACIQLLKMPLPFGKFYVYAPYGPVASDQWIVISGQFLSQLKEVFPEAIFIRLECKNKSLFANNHSLIAKSTNIQPAKTLLISLHKSAEELLSEMHPKTRYNIKLAQRHECQIKDEFGISIGHGLYFREAVELISQTAKRQGFVTYGASYYENLINFFALNKNSQIQAHLYKAIYKNELLACAIMIDFGKTRSFLFGGSSAAYKNVMAPYLLHFQAMLDAKLLSFDFYDFWGIETSKGETPGFVKFKLGFGGEVKEYAGAYDRVESKGWYKTYLFTRAINRLIRKK